MKSHGKSKAVLSAIIFEVILLQSSRFGEADRMKENREEYQNEKEKREKRLLAYADMIQSAVQQDSSEVIRQLVEERKRQRLTQQELSDITGVRTSNIARFEGGTRIPTLLMLEKYANALGKHIEVSIRDKE